MMVEWSDGPSLMLKWLNIYLQVCTVTYIFWGFGNPHPPVRLLRNLTCLSYDLSTDSSNVAQSYLEAVSVNKSTNIFIVAWVVKTRYSKVLTAERSLEQKFPVGAGMSRRMMPNRHCQAVYTSDLSGDSWKRSSAADSL